MIIFKNKNGFTLIELLLAITIAGIIFGVAAETMMQQAQTYSFITNRKATIADVRHAMNRISGELLHVEREDITSISASNFSFTDVNGDATSYRLDTYGDSLAVYRGDDGAILPDVESFNIEYQDGSGNTLDADDSSIDEVVRIKITVTTADQGNAGNMSVSTTVIPRSFLGYTNFQ